MLTDDRFRDAAMKFTLLRDTDNKYFTLDEYKTLIETSQTDKDGDLVYIYATDPVAQYTYIKAANDHGYNVLLMDGQLDSHFIGMLESKLEKSRFVRVDSDVVDNLVPKSDKPEANLTLEQRNMLTAVFRSQINKIDKTEFLVSFEAMATNTNPIVITQNEYMRRMKDMAAMQPGMNFYGELPDSYNLIVNTENPVIKRIIDDVDKNVAPDIKPLNEQITTANDKIKTINDAVKDNKPSDEQKAEIKAQEDEIGRLRADSDKLASEYAAKLPVVKQVVDLALLANGLLKGRDLNEFISRSVSLL